MADGDIVSFSVPVTLDYLAPADIGPTLVDTSDGFLVAEIDIINVTIVDVSGKNSVRKTVFTTIGRSIS